MGIILMSLMDALFTLNLLSLGAAEIKIAARFAKILDVGVEHQADCWIERRRRALHRLNWFFDLLDPYWRRPLFFFQLIDALQSLLDDLVVKPDIELNTNVSKELDALLEGELFFKPDEIIIPTKIAIPKFDEKVVPPKY